MDRRNRRIAAARRRRARRVAIQRYASLGVICLGMLGFVGVYAWQQYAAANRPPVTVPSIAERLDAVPESGAKDVAERLMLYAEIAEDHEMLTHRAADEIDREVRRAVRDGRFRDKELIRIADAISMAALGVEIDTRADVDEMLAQQGL